MIYVYIRNKQKFKIRLKKFRTTNANTRFNPAFSQRGVNSGKSNIENLGKSWHHPNAIMYTLFFT